MNNESCCNIIPTAGDILTVNEMYQKCIYWSNALAEAYADWERRRDESAAVRELQEKYQKASKAFDDFKARMGEVKFDTERGVYFAAKDENGLENFRIKVTRTQTQTFCIASTSEEHAIETAKALVAGQRGKCVFGPAADSFEDVSR